jgi:hypothetical protein
MQQQRSLKVNTYLLAPYQWLRSGAYHLIGKHHCEPIDDHQLGGYHIAMSNQLSSRQRFFCLLFPFVVGVMVALGLALIWVFSFATGQYLRQLPDYLWAAPLWHHALHLVWILLLTYILLLSFYDVLMVFRLLRQQRRSE